MDKQEFAELLVYHGRRKIGSEWHGRTPLQLAEQYHVSERALTRWLEEWRSKGFYVSAQDSPLEGYLTTWGKESLRIPH